ncbi:OLC1v1020327C1 [Oldenlandia corymbosa var. corymbosa]|uniref:OLC1v1020327C1 n=1 Tax=Oldenlandia corymbosa var. corymbosa TaxID=529605 RepID=A0AAV1EG66_OLDCO|nr:OLC1v1020327C1 [Oldenlandia corymbosa var. corymbosa]
MKRQLILAQDSLPDDVALSIMKFLEVSDVCSLGSCSKFWREISTSECLWKHLCQLRWPGIVLEDEIEAEIHDHDQPKMPSLKGWRGLYVKKHNLMAEKAAVVRKSLSCSEIDVNMYHKALEDMKRMQFGFKDVQMFFLKSGINVLLNFVGLHYCIKELGVQVGSMTEALNTCNIQDRLVYIQWWEAGNWLHRFKPPDVLHARRVPLYDFTSVEGAKILRMLERGIAGDILCIKMYSSEPHNKRNPTRICTMCKGLRKDDPQELIPSAIPQSS